MNKWNRLLAILDQVCGFEDKKKSAIRKVGQHFDERTNEHVFHIEYRVRRGGRAMFLVGTFNKILSYTDEVYFDLHYLFMRHIRTTDRLIVCGYSFGDKAINSQIARWVFDRPNRKLIICHPRVERVRDGARGAIRNNWERWQDNGNIEVVPKYIQNIIWSDLHSVL